MGDLVPVSSVVARGPLPLSQSAKIVIRVCRLLEAVHATGQSHGRVCAENVWFSHTGGDLEVELTDGQTPSAGYATPERAQGDSESPAGDVYALGLLFFDMVLGRLPFTGADEEVVRQHAEAAPPSLADSELQDVPQELQALVATMLAKSPAERPAVSVVAATVENLDLDSTVMGMRLNNLKDLAEEIQAEVLEAEAEAPPKFDPKMLENVPVDSEGVRTDPVIVDPFADTFIKSRAEFGLEGVDGEQDTAVSMEAQPAVSSPDWSMDQQTRIVADSSPVDPTPATRASRSMLIFAVGAAFFVGAIVTLLFALLR